MPPSSSPDKECTAIVLDVSPSFRPHLEDAVAAVRALLNTKILFHGKDAIGLFAHGTEGTDNLLANTEEHEGQYQHVTELHKMGPVSSRTLRALNGVADLASEQADLVDSMTIGMYAVIQHTGKLKWAKRIIVITDGTSPATADDEEIQTICAEMTKNDVKLDVMGFGFDPELPGAAAGAAAASAAAAAGGDDEAAEARAGTCALLRGIHEHVGERLTFRSLHDAIDMMRSLQKKAVRSATSYRGALQIGPGLALPVWSWRKVVPQTAPSMKAVSKAVFEAEQDDDFDPSSTVMREARHYVPSAPDQDVPPHMSVSGYRYGKDLVPVAGADVDRVKYGVESKVLELVGFLPQSSTPRHLFTSRAECVVADPETLGPAAHRALQALILALEEDEMLAICRYAPRKGAPPSVVALWPAIRSFWMVSLPFADELKAFDWGPPPTAPPPSAAQLEAAGALIDAMELAPEAPEAAEEEGGAEGGEAAPEESLVPKHVFSTKLQRLYQCISARALATITGGASGERGNLPEPDWRVTRPYQQDEELMSRAADALAAFAGACPLSEAASGGKRGRTNAPAAEGDAGKRLRPDSSGASPAKGDGGTQPLSLTHTVPEKIDTGNPIPSFWTMCEHTEVNLVKKACEGLAKAVRALLCACDASDDPTAEKAYACLRELRRGSLLYEEVAPYNAELKALKEAYASGPKAAVWERIVGDAALKGGLITADETEESEEPAGDVDFDDLLD